MDNDNRSDAPSPPWWLFVIVALCLVVMWNVGGLSRALWWIGLLLGCLAMTFAVGWMGKLFLDQSAAQATFYGISKLFYLATGLIFLFGVLVTGSTIIGPSCSIFNGSRHVSDDLPDNWRR